MHTCFSLLTIVTALAVSSTALPQTMTPVEKVGGWDVMANKDAMTDRISCVAYYGDNKRIQLTEGSLAFSVAGQGGVDGYIVRLDDSPAGDMQIPNDIEKQIGAIVLRFADLVPIKTASRIRVRIVTMVGPNVDEDVDLRDLAAALAILSGPKCTG